ncbi:MAG: hypothetical protein H6Q14_2239 [Bacteroidetes bacterium]|nr:hypothetical protein [Bacteroidota bacterium]
MLENLFVMSLILVCSVSMIATAQPIDVKPVQPGGTPPIRTLSQPYIPLAASLENNNQAIVSFEYPIGLAIVSIADANGAIIESRIADTDQDDEVSILLDGYDSGSYTLHIEYGSIQLAGGFEKE